MTKSLWLLCFTIVMALATVIGLLKGVWIGAAITAVMGGGCFYGYLTVRKHPLADTDPFTSHTPPSPPRGTTGGGYGTGWSGKDRPPERK
jgi:hypothetical protein